MALSRKERDSMSEKALTPIPNAKPKQKDFAFVDLKFNKDGVFLDLKVKLVELRDLLRSFGFVRYDLGKNFIYAKLYEKVIEEVSANQIIDEFETWLNVLPKKIEIGDDVIEKKYLLNKIFNGIGTYFSDKILARLRPEEPIIINKDLHNNSYFFYENGFVLVTPETYLFKKYKDLSGYVWKNQILKREYKKISLNEEVEPADIKKNWGVFADFCFKVSGQNQERMFSLMSIIGYLLHNNTEGKRRAVILTDSSLSDRAEGRTGKTLFGKAIGKMVNRSDDKSVYVELSGKDFDPTYKHKYQECTLDTRLVHLNDVTDYFNFSVLYNDISEGISVNIKANPIPLKVHAKILLSTNRTIKIEGASDRDRCIEFEFANYFSDKHSPEQEYGHWFFRDWENTEWQLFDNFQIMCTMVYLRCGVIRSKSINLERRKLLDYTNNEFVEWVDDLVKTGSLKLNAWYNVKTLNEEFLQLHNDYHKDKHHTQKRFNKWLQNYANYNESLISFNKEKHYKKLRDGYEFMFEQNTDN
jgi:hypothetical protein